MKLALLALLTIIALPLQAAAAPSATDCKPTVTGRLDIFDLQSSVFGNSRKLRVWLPPGYSDPSNKERNYPVLYIFDAQNVFDVCTSYAHKEWQVDETLTRLIGEGKVEPLIVVGIDHAGDRRAYEWLPWQDNIQNPGGSATGGVRLPEFLIKDVMPVVQARYRFAKGRENTAIAGSSYGGVAALYVGVMAPTVFGKVLGESPVLWVGNGQIMRDTVGIPTAPSRTFLAYGMKEWKIPGANEASAKMLNQLAVNLRSATFEPGEVRVVIEPDAAHNEDAWAKRFAQAIQYLFPKNAAPDASQQN